MYDINILFQIKLEVKIRRESIDYNSERQHRILAYAVTLQSRGMQTDMSSNVTVSDLKLSNSDGSKLHFMKVA